VRTSAYFEEGGRQETPVWTLDQLAPGHRVAGPALLIDDISTIVVEPSCEAEVRLCVPGEVVSIMLLCTNRVGRAQGMCVRLLHV